MVARFADTVKSAVSALPVAKLASIAKPVKQAKGRQRISDSKIAAILAPYGKHWNPAKLVTPAKPAPAAAAAAAKPATPAPAAPAKQAAAPVITPTPAQPVTTKIKGSWRAPFVTMADRRRMAEEAKAKAA